MPRLGARHPDSQKNWQAKEFMKTLITQVREFKAQEALALSFEEQAKNARDQSNDMFSDIITTLGTTTATAERVVREMSAADIQKPVEGKRKSRRRLVRRATNKKVATKKASTSPAKAEAKVVAKVKRGTDLQAKILEVAGDDVIGPTEVCARLATKGLKLTVPNVRYYMVRPPFKKLGRGKFQQINGTAEA